MVFLQVVNILSEFPLSGRTLYLLRNVGSDLETLLNNR